MDLLEGKEEAKVETEQTRDFWWLSPIISFLGLLALIITGQYYDELGVALYASLAFNILAVTLWLYKWALDLTFNKRKRK